MLSDAQFQRRVHGASTLSPQPPVIPTSLDFGSLQPGVRQIKTFTVHETDTTAQGFSVRCSPHSAWFQIVRSERVFKDAPFPLKFVVAIDTTDLIPGRSYDGWISIDMGELSTCVSLAVRIPNLSTRQPFTGIGGYWPIAAFILVCIMAGLLAIPLFRTLALSRGTSNEVTLTEVQTPQYAFSVLENAQLELYLAQLDGSGQFSLGVNGWAPAWSPDGTQIAFVGDSAGMQQIYVLTLPNQLPVQVTDLPGAKFAPTWSPDGQRLAFIAGQDGRGALHIIDIPDVLIRTSTGLDITPLQSNTDVLRQLVTAAFDPEESSAPSTAVTGHFAWAPDGQSIIFDLYQNNISQVYRIDKEGMDLLVESGGREPAWSPDGRQIAVASDIGIYILGEHGQEIQRLATPPAHRPAWSSDGRYLAFLSDEGITADALNPTQNLWVTDVDGKTPRQLTVDGCLDFIWSAPDSLAYISGNTETVPPTLYLWQRSLSAETQQLVAEVNAPYVALKP